jgi:hypothetical protein
MPGPERFFQFGTENLVGKVVPVLVSMLYHEWVSGMLALKEPRPRRTSRNDGTWACAKTADDPTTGFRFVRARALAAERDLFE